jgi:uncharacterized surface anchored protein
MMLILGAHRIYGQQSTGTIQGAVVDQSGQALQGATVAVTSLSGVKSTAVSGAEGKCSVGGLKPGEYKVEVSATGFAA